MKKAKPIASMTACCAILAVTIAAGLSADGPQSAFELPANPQVVAYLLESVKWYRHVYTERQVANDPVDLLFLEDNQAIETQIVRLSFEFAKADATLATAVPSQHNGPTTPASAGPPTSDLAHFIELKNRSDQQREKAIHDVDTLQRDIGVVRKADRKRVEAALDDAQSRLELMRAVSQTMNGLVEFVQTAETGQGHLQDLNSTIYNLAQSLPEVNGPARPVGNSSAQDGRSSTMLSESVFGVLELTSEVSALRHKLSAIDEKMRLTDDLALSRKNLRTPMTGFITQLIQSASISESTDLSVLQQQKSQLDALTLQLRELSPAIVALDKQKVLLAEYESHLLSWRTAVASQYRQAWKKLMLRLVIVLVIIGLVIGIGEVARRLTLNNIQDLNRQRIVGLVYRLVTLLASAVAAVFGLASDARSLATYFGLLTAGVAVALQNVILASLGYLLLIAKHGIRLGDRVQISGVTGDVIYMGLLQFQLREFDAARHVVTGRLATFSNSLVFSTVILKKAINLDQRAAPDPTRL